MLLSALLPLLALLAPMAAAVPLPAECVCKSSPLTSKTIDYILRLAGSKRLTPEQCEFICNPSSALTAALDRAVPDVSSVAVSFVELGSIPSSASTPISTTTASAVTTTAFAPPTVTPTSLSTPPPAPTGSRVPETEPPPLFDPATPHPPTLFFAPPNLPPSSLLPRPPPIPQSRMEALAPHEAALPHAYDTISPYQPSATEPSAHRFSRSWGCLLLQAVAAVLALLGLAAGVVLGTEIGARMLWRSVRRQRAVMRQRAALGRRATVGAGARAFREESRRLLARGRSATMGSQATEKWDLEHESGWP